MITHGKYCDFSFYVVSFDTKNHYSAAEPNAENLSLEQAKDEFVKRINRHPETVNTMLGVMFTTSRKDLEPAGMGAADLVQYIGGKPRISADYRRTPVLNYEKLISENTVGVLRKFIEGLTDSETKLLHAGLVNGDNEEIHSQSTAVKSEIEHHNELEDKGLVNDDQLEI